MEKRKGERAEDGENRDHGRYELYLLVLRSLLGLWPFSLLPPTHLRSMDQPAKLKLILDPNIVSSGQYGWHSNALPYKIIQKYMLLSRMRAPGGKTQTDV